MSRRTEACLVHSNHVVTPLMLTDNAQLDRFEPTCEVLDPISSEDSRYRQQRRSLAKLRPMVIPMASVVVAVMSMSMVVVAAERMLMCTLVVLVMVAVEVVERTRRERW